MSQASPSGTNTYIPAHDATDGMIVGYSRNPKGFAINRYSALKPVKRTAGKYLFLDPSENARVRDKTGADSVWADGADSPSGARNAIRFEFQNYSTVRHRESVMTGRKALEQADWSIEDANARMLAQRNMTLRTRKALNLLATSNWGSNTAAASDILGSGKHMGNGDETSPNIKKVIQSVGIAIHKATYGAVRPGDLKMVANPTAATLMSQSAEIQKAMIQSPFALDQIKGEPNVNEQWGLPRRLYGMPLEIEDCVYEGAAKYAADAPAFALDTAAIYFVAQPNDKQVVAEDSPEDDRYAPVLNTLIGFFYEEFTVEGWDEPKHRRVEATVTSDYDFRLSSALTGFALTAAFGV